MIDPRTLAAFDLPPDATGPQIAARMRELAGLPADPDTNVELWTYLLDGIEWVRTASPDPREDVAVLAHGLATWALDEDRFGITPWEHELGVDFEDTDNVLRMFVINEIAPRLDAAGLIRLI